MTELRVNGCFLQSSVESLDKKPILRNISIYDQHKFKKLEILLKILFRPLGKILAARGLETNNFSRETKTVLVGFILVIMKNISEAQKFHNGCCRVRLNH